MVRRSDSRRGAARDEESQLRRRKSAPPADRRREHRGQLHEWTFATDGSTGTNREKRSAGFDEAGAHRNVAGPDRDRLHVIRRTLIAGGSLAEPQDEPGKGATERGYEHAGPRRQLHHRPDDPEGPVAEPVIDIFGKTGEYHRGEAAEKSRERRPHQRDLPLGRLKFLLDPNPPAQQP